MEIGQQENGMKIAILGSTGFVGKVLLEKALEKGYEVATLVRDPEKLGVFKEKVHFIQGDIFQASKIEECVEGVEVVFSTVPPEGNTDNPEKYAELMKGLVSIFVKKGIKRFIHIGGAGHAGGIDENWTIGRKFLKYFLEKTWKQGLIAKQLEWEVLKTSNLDWTLVRPPRIKNGTSGKKVYADEKKLKKTVVYVGDLAYFMLDQIESREWIKKAPLVASA